MIFKAGRQVFRYWSLELKCLVFLGIALFISLVLAFYAVQGVAKRLVMETTRQSARDYAFSALGWSHVSAYGNLKQKNVTQKLAPIMFRSDYQLKTLRAPDSAEFENLPGELPVGDLETEIMSRLAIRQRKRSEARAKDAALEGTAPEDTEVEDPNQFGFGLGVPNQRDLIYAEAGPIDGQYYYYQPISFGDSCRGCHVALATHSQDTGANPDAIPFRVLRVEMPYSRTRTWAMWSFSVMMAIGLATLAFILFCVHWILERLVMQPLGHLREVSDEISRGKTELRANIDTDDEFRELGDAFNQMVLNMTETQSQLRRVNSELDRRVDQLAHANLQLYEANRLKSDFLANMSHELRTPLNSILGFSEVLQGVESLTEKQKRYAANIQKSGRLLLEMINDILDLAKVEAGKMEVRPTHFDLVHVLHGQCDLVRNLAEQKNIDVHIETGYKEWVVYQDQTKIQQILTNLLSNAIKFTPEGGLITVSLHRLAGQQFALTVADTGVGIAAEEFEIIFQKFRQSKQVASEDTATREFSGTGLGLSIVRELCRLLGGDIRLTSQLGQGSSFEVTLPEHYEASSSAARELAMKTAPF